MDKEKEEAIRILEIKGYRASALRRIYIEKKLGLKVNVTKSKVTKPNDIKYLGFGFFLDDRSKLWKAKPHQKSVEKLKKKLKRLTSRSWGVDMDHRLRRIEQG